MTRVFTTWATPTSTLPTWVDTVGDAIERYVYSLHGVITTYDATRSNIRPRSLCGNAYTYTGRPLDKEIGIYQYRHRVYQAALGRFCGRDPIGYEAGARNLCAYVHGRPTFFLDPYGLEPKVCAAIGHAIAVGDYELALLLIRGGIGRCTSKTLVMGCIAKVMDKLPPAAMKCGQARDLIVQCFQSMGCNPVSVRVIGSRGERFFFIGKQCSPEPESISRPCAMGEYTTLLPAQTE